MLCQELAKPKFRDYHIFFSNIVAKQYIQTLADADTFDVIRQVGKFNAVILS